MVMNDTLSIVLTVMKKKTRRNSGGLSIYFKFCFFSDGITINKEDIDDIIWLKFSKTSVVYVMLYQLVLPDKI